MARSLSRSLAAYRSKSSRFAECSRAVQHSCRDTVGIASIDLCRTLRNQGARTLRPMHPVPCPSADYARITLTISFGHILPFVCPKLTPTQERFVVIRHCSLFRNSFSWARLRANSCVRQLRGFCFPGSSPKTWVPSQNAAARFGSRSPRSWVPQENGAEKGDSKCLTYMLSGIASGVVCSPAV